jgi:hypothetical protein
MVIRAAAVGVPASMKMLSQDEGLISPRDWKLNAERRFSLLLKPD